MCKTLSVTNWTSVTANVAAIVLASAFSEVSHIFQAYFYPCLPPYLYRSYSNLCLRREISICFWSEQNIWYQLWWKHTGLTVLTPKRVLPEPMWKISTSIGHPWSFDLMLTLRDCCYPSWRDWMWAVDARCAVTTNWKFLMRLSPQGGLVCSALTECSCRSALTDASEGTFCGNELLIPEGRAGKIRLIWTLLLGLIFVMQSYSVAAARTWKNRWMWIMVPPLLPVPAHLWLSYLKRSSPLLVCTRQDQTIIYLFLPSASNHRNTRGALTSYFVIGSEMWNMYWSLRVSQSPDGPSGYLNYIGWSQWMHHSRLWGTLKRSY